VAVLMAPYNMSSQSIMACFIVVFELLRRAHGSV
jgi:hypothetical protein